jgi:hypothetical protein
METSLSQVMYKKEIDLPFPGHGENLVALGHGLLGDLGDARSGKIELLEQHFEGRGLSERLHTDEFSVKTKVLVPPKVSCKFNAHPSTDLGWKDRILVYLALALKQVHGRHRHDTGLDTLGDEDIVGTANELDFGSRSDQNAVRFAIRSGTLENVASLLSARGRRIVTAVHSRKILTRQDEDGRSVCGIPDPLPRLNVLVGITRTEGDKSWNGSHHGQMFDGLMCRT